MVLFLKLTDAYQTVTSGSSQAHHETHLIALSEIGLISSIGNESLVTLKNPRPGVNSIRVSESIEHISRLLGKVAT